MAELEACLPAPRGIDAPVDLGLDAWLEPTRLGGDDVSIALACPFRCTLAWSHDETGARWLQIEVQQVTEGRRATVVRHAPASALPEFAEVALVDLGVRGRIAIPPDTMRTLLGALREAMQANGEERWVPVGDPSTALAVPATVERALAVRTEHLRITRRDANGIEGALQRPNGTVGKQTMTLFGGMGGGGLGLLVALFTGLVAPVAVLALAGAGAVGGLAIGQQVARRAQREPFVLEGERVGFGARWVRRESVAAVAVSPAGDPVTDPVGYLVLFGHDDQPIPGTAMGAGEFRALPEMAALLRAAWSLEAATADADVEWASPALRERALACHACRRGDKLVVAGAVVDRAWVWTPNGVRFPRARLREIDTFSTRLGTFDRARNLVTPSLRKVELHRFRGEVYLVGGGFDVRFQGDGDAVAMVRFLELLSAETDGAV